MMIHVETTRGLRRMRVEGDVTIYNAAEFKRQLMDQLGAAPVVEVNLSRVGEMDTAGFQVLYLAKREAARNGKALQLVSHSAAVLEVTDLYNMATYFGDPMVIGRTRKRARPTRHRPKGKKAT